jgi:DNA-binding NarL/FixJ family response regulator
LKNSTLEKTDGQTFFFRILDALLLSGNHQEFCKAVVHGDFSSPHVQGAHLFNLDETSFLTWRGGYGSRLEKLDGLSVWSDNSFGEAIRTKKTIIDTSHKLHSDKNVISIPLDKRDMPVGCLALVVDGQLSDRPFPDEVETILKKVAAYFLITGQPGFNGTLVQGGASPDDLTSRQIKILELMGEGLINSEIAKALLLSESTIRQETVRIYRALGVPNRSEAAKKARKLGLIKPPSANLERSAS